VDAGPGDQRPVHGGEGVAVTAWDFLHAATPYVWSRERSGYATKSEKKRWLLNNAVRVNGQPLRFNEEVDFPVFSMVLFPNGDRITLI
jgi:hypothetical protein